MKPAELLNIKDHKAFLEKVFKTVKDRRTRTALNRLWIETHRQPGAGDEYRRMRMRSWASLHRNEMYDYKLERHTKHNYRLGEEREEWNTDRIRRFLSMNENGKVDREIARRLDTSIPMVYYLRRKLKIISEYQPDLVQPRKSTGAENVRKESLIAMMQLGEQRLKKMAGKS